MNKHRLRDQNTSSHALQTSLLGFRLAASGTESIPSGSSFSRACCVVGSVTTGLVLGRSGLRILASGSTAMPVQYALGLAPTSEESEDRVGATLLRQPNVLLLSGRTCMHL